MEDSKIKNIEVKVNYTKNRIIVALALTCLILLLYFRFKDDFKSNFKDDFISYRVGANQYKIHEDLNNPELAADTLDKLNRMAKKLIYTLNDKYINNKDGFNLIKNEYKNKVITGIVNLNNNFKTTSLEENIPSRSDNDTSYVIDKGDIFALCVRDPNNNNSIEENFNDLVFVMLHELSHIFTVEFGHGTEFWTNFKFILNEAVKDNLYTAVDYKKLKAPYCGIKISYSPIYDTGLDNYLITSIVDKYKN
jgi:hypothetical protein